SLQHQILKAFIRSPLTTHNKVNPCNSKAILAYDGANFQLWETALDRTLRHVFSKLTSFVSDPMNFVKLRQVKSSSVSGLMRNTIYALLKKKCSRSDRRHKIDLMSDLLNLINDPTPASELTLSKWAQLKSELDQLKLTWDEAVGILLQSNFKPPSGVELKNFEFSVDQQLNKQDSPSFYTFNWEAPGGWVESGV
ncbi:uncharacterized protein VP01_11077g1, partial [Puccinia sorghi]